MIGLFLSCPRKAFQYSMVVENQKNRCMYRVSLLIVLFSMLFSSVVCAQWSPGLVKSTIEKISPKSYHSHFDSLQTTFGKSRKVVEGKKQLPGHDACRDYLYRQLKNYLGEEKVFLHSFSAGRYGGLTNVYGVKPGRNQGAGIWIIGAHYDSNNSREPMPGRSDASPGANDNGTGLAAVLELARVLSMIDTKATIIFAFWDFEEQFYRGFPAGSNQWLLHATREAGTTQWDSLGFKASINRSDIKLCLNFDMFGNPQLQKDGKKVLWLCSANDKHNKSIDAYRDVFSFFINDIIVENFGKMIFSDHYTFAARNILAIEHLESDYSNDPFYHTYSDHLENDKNIDFDFATKVTQGALAYVLHQSGFVPDSLLPANKWQQTVAVFESPWGYSVKTLNQVRMFSVAGQELKTIQKNGLRMVCPPAAGFYYLIDCSGKRVKRTSVFLEPKPMTRETFNCQVRK